MSLFSFCRFSQSYYFLLLEKEEKKKAKEEKKKKKGGAAAGVTSDGKGKEKDENEDSEGSESKSDDVSSFVESEFMTDTEDALTVTEVCVTYV